MKLNWPSRSIERQTESIAKRMKGGLTGRTLNSSKDAEEIANALRTMSYYVDLFHVSQPYQWRVLPVTTIALG